MSEEAKRAKGRAKNARNQLQNMQLKLRKGEAVDKDSVDYTLEEVLASLEHIDEVIWGERDD